MCIVAALLFEDPVTLGREVGSGYLYCILSRISCVSDIERWENERCPVSFSQCSQIVITANGGDCGLRRSLSISFLIKRLLSVKGSAGFIEGSISTIIHHLANHTPEYFLEPVCDPLTPLPALLGESTCFVYREWVLLILYIVLYSYCLCLYMIMHKCMHMPLTYVLRSEDSFWELVFSFYCGFWVVNSGRQPCAASTVLSEPSCQTNHHLEFYISSHLELFLWTLMAFWIVPVTAVSVFSQSLVLYCFSACKENRACFCAGWVKITLYGGTSKDLFVFSFVPSSVLLIVTSF